MFSDSALPKRLTRCVRILGRTRHSPIDFVILLTAKANCNTPQADEPVCPPLCSHAVLTSSTSTRTLHPCICSSAYLTKDISVLSSPNRGGGRDYFHLEGWKHQFVVIKVQREKVETKGAKFFTMGVDLGNRSNEY